MTTPTPAATTHAHSMGDDSTTNTAQTGHLGDPGRLHTIPPDIHRGQHLAIWCLESEHLHSAGLLLPLPVQQAVWIDIDLDFVEAMPRVGGKSVILMVVDRFSKYCQFIPLAHPYSAESVVQAFLADIVCLHGEPQSMVSDRDPVFTSAFSKELIDTKLHMTTAFHPHLDGQTKTANIVVVMYLRCFKGDRPRQWLRWLRWAEYVYNMAYQTSL
jgi:hypothetical protein